jgi:di- and tripeptidase
MDIVGARTVLHQAAESSRTNSLSSDISDADLVRNEAQNPTERSSDGHAPQTKGRPPELFHKVQHDSSILALAASDEFIYAGTQEGEILVWSLASYELVIRIQAHKRAVLCLFLSQDGSLLFSSAGDAIVNVFDPKTLKRVYHIYSTYDVGDVFSVAYSAQFETVYLGAQNTSIQWVSLKDTESRPTPNEHRHPDRRNHRFFDSVAKGGALTPRPATSGRSAMMGGETLEIDKAHLRQYAHFGYVHCMLLVRGASRLVGVDEDMLISGGGDGTIKLWQLSSDPDHGISELTQLGEDDAEGVLSLALDGSFLYSGKVDGIIELWDLDTKQKLRVIKAHKGDIMTLQMGWGILWSAGSTGFARVGASSWNSYTLETNIIRRNTAPYNMVNIATTQRHSRRSTSA